METGCPLCAMSPSAFEIEIIKQGWINPDLSDAPGDLCSLEVLSSAEVAFLGYLLGANISIDPATLAVYVVTTPEHGYEKVVAPASEAIVGMTVIAEEFTATATRLPSNSVEEPTLSVASTLVPHSQT